MPETLVSDVRFALRRLRRSPMFTLVAIASLAIGIGFNTALFTLVDALPFRPLPVERPDRLVDVFTSGGDADQYATSSYPRLPRLQGAESGVQRHARVQPGIRRREADRSIAARDGRTVTGNYFQLLGVTALVGRTLVPDDERSGAPRAVVISYRLWNREYGASGSAVGQSIRIHGQPYTLVGVAPAAFTGMVPLLAPEVWLPMTYVDDVEPGGIIDVVPSPDGNTRLERRGTRWMFVKGRLEPGVTYDAVAANMGLIGQRLQTAYGQTNKRFYVSTVPTKDVHIHPMADRVLRPIGLALMLPGRNFAPADTPASPGVVIVNEAMARKCRPDQHPIGKRIRLLTYNGRELEIVGVSADYKGSSIGESATPYIHYAVSQRPDSGEQLVARTRGDAGALLNALRRELTALEPNILFLDNQTMDAQVAATLLPAKAGAISVSAVGVVGIVLASIGLYGVIAYSVARRTREIGIRMALGATPTAVVGSVMRQGLGLAAVGAGVGAVMALGAAKAVAGALYGVSFVDPIAWLAAIATVFFVATIANLVPARRASIVDPSRALRSE